MDEKSVRSLMAITSHLPRGWVGERYSCSDSLSLLTAADEVRHANAQHRATSDPSEGRTVKAGEREADLLGIANCDIEGAVIVYRGCHL